MILSTRVYNNDRVYCFISNFVNTENIQLQTLMQNADRKTESDSLRQLFNIHIHIHQYKSHTTCTVTDTVGSYSVSS